jgi:hypothetical protein
MVDKCISAINNDNLVGLAAIDFRKAFDVLPHDILTQKLSLYGCDHQTVTWFSSYLTNRVQQVSINNTLSEAGYLSQGVPQGSILGPLLFSLFINDLPLHIENCDIFSYADDTNLTVSAITIEDIQNKLSRDLTVVEAWCNNNQLVINTSKSKCMLICTQQKRQHLITDTLNLSLYGTSLENVECQKILGVYIDKNLTWRSHIDCLCNSVSQLIGLLSSKKKCLPYTYRLLFYKSYILPKIDYCITIWGKASHNLLDRIWRLQKRAIRIICNLSFNGATRHFFTQLGIHNIYERYLYQLCVTVYKIINTDDAPLSNLIKLHHHSSYNLRSRNPHMLHVPFPNKEIFRQSLSYSGAVYGIIFHTINCLLP